MDPEAKPVLEQLAQVRDLHRKVAAAGADVQIPPEISTQIANAKKAGLLPPTPAHVDGAGASAAATSASAASASTGSDAPAAQQPQGASGAEGMNSAESAATGPDGATGGGDGAAPSNLSTPARKPPSNKVTAPKSVPLELYPPLAQALVKAGPMGVPSFCKQFVAIHPGPSQRQVADVMSHIGVKEKRDGDKRASWYLREEYAPLLEGHIPSADDPLYDFTRAAATPKPKSSRPSTPTVPGSASVANDIPEEEPEEDDTVPFFGDIAPNTALMVCEAMRANFEERVYFEPPVVPSDAEAKPDLSADWKAVAAAPELKESGLTPYQCQRVWKYIAYGIDIGERDTFAEDSDVEEIQAASASRSAKRARVGTPDRSRAATPVPSASGSPARPTDSASAAAEAANSTTTTGASAAVSAAAPSPASQPSAQFSAAAPAPGDQVSAAAAAAVPAAASADTQ